MPQSSPPTAPDRIAGMRAAVFTVADAVLYSAGMYAVLRAALLRMDNVVDIQGLLYPVTFFVIFLFASRSIYSHFNNAPVFSNLTAELSFMFAVVVGAAAATTRISAFDLNALPLWWRELPVLARRIFSDAPGQGLCMAALFVSLSLLSSRGKRAIPAIASLSFYFASVICCAFVFGKHSAIPVIASTIAWLFPVSAALLSKPRLFSRSMFVCCIAFFISLRLAGILPAVSNPQNPATGVYRIYPGVSSASFPPFFISSIAPIGDGMLVVAGGKSGMLAVVDSIKGREAALFSKEGANFSGVTVNTDTGSVYAIDSEGGKLYFFENASLKNPSSKKVSNEWCLIPRMPSIRGKTLLISCENQPGIMEYEADTLEQTGSVKFRESGATPFRAGAWDYETRGDGSIYAIAGATAEPGKSLLAIIDSMRFRMAGAVALPVISNNIALDPAGGKLFASGGDKIVVITLPELSVSRSLPCPAIDAAISMDPRRNLIYAGGGHDGVFAVIEASSGKTIRSDRICGGIKSIEISPDGSAAFIACGNGIFRAGLK